MVTDLILGTAGHIDHGKTSLIRALTGVDTDRLPEEKKRGITIELGFAELELGEWRLGIVDVPGHERFVRNMLAGATGVDVALLVIAADDSVKPQTREHLEILRLLDLKVGVIALTKCDLADEDWVDLVTEEIRELVKDTFLAEAPIIRTSAETGEGLDALRDALTDAAKRANAERGEINGTPFRMAIDRTFTIAGHGTVVTGSVVSGRAAVGDELIIEPGAVKVRLRGLENHDRNVESVHRGQRAAINLAGVHHDEVRRGHELASRGHLAPGRIVTVHLSLLPTAPRPLKNRSRMRVHLGAAELMCSVVLLEDSLLSPGQSAMAQLYLAEPCVATWRQPFVLRSESPVLTIGGGHVLTPDAQKLRKPNDALMQKLNDLLADDPICRASAALYFAGLNDWRPEDLARTAGISDTTAAHAALIERGDLAEIRLSPTRTLRVHSDVLQELAERITAALEKMHEQEPLRTMLDRSRLAHRFEYLDAPLLAAALDQMAAERRVRLSGDGVALYGHGPQLSENERKLLEKIVVDYQTAGLQPPTVKQVKDAATKNQASVPQLVALAAGEGRLVEISPEFYLHAEADRHLRDTLREKMTGHEGMTMSEIREALGTTRKYAVPFCEYLDRAGFTRREGDVRVLVEHNE